MTSVEKMRLLDEASPRYRKMIEDAYDEGFAAGRMYAPILNIKGRRPRVTIPQVNLPRSLRSKRIGRIAVSSLLAMILGAVTFAFPKIVGAIAAFIVAGFLFLSGIFISAVLILLTIISLGSSITWIFGSNEWDALHGPLNRFFSED